MSSSRTALPGLRRMVGRDPNESDRVASSLELFFDLSFVVAVSVAADGLLEFDERGEPGAGAEAYILVFFGIWWAWMGFTWFASAFDTDDWLYRLLTVAQIAGVLVIAAGIPSAMQRFDLGVVVIGYVLIRLAQVAQYLRAARDSRYRRTELRYAMGVTAAEVLWILNLLTPSPLRVVTFLLLVALELTVPLVAESGATTPFHRGHIADRYGAFTLIVLGEGLLPVTAAVIEAVRSTERLASLLLLAGSALALVAGMWWIYFAREQRNRLTSFRPVFVFGYTHYLVFAAAGAIAAGVQTAIHDRHHGLGSLTPGVQALTTVPVAIFLAAVWVLALRSAVAPRASALVVVLTVLVGCAALVPYGVTVAALLVIAIVVVLEVDGRVTRAHAA